MQVGKRSIRFRKQPHLQTRFQGVGVILVLGMELHKQRPQSQKHSVSPGALVNLSCSLPRIIDDVNTAKSRTIRFRIPESIARRADSQAVVTSLIPKVNVILELHPEQKFPSAPRIRLSIPESSWRQIAFSAASHFFLEMVTEDTSVLRFHLYFLNYRELASEQQ